MPAVKSSGSPEFDRLKKCLDSNESLRRELEWALEANLNRINPSDRANRFGSGAAVEWILAAAAYNAGILTAPAGHNVDGYDLRNLRAKAQGLWSVKNTTRPRTDFRLTNGMGGAGRGFVEPVIFLSPSLPGLTFADPNQHPSLADSVQVLGDATVLKFRSVLQHALSNPECVATCRMPTNMGEGRDDPWMDYVESLLDSSRFPLLSKMFLEARSHGNSIVEVLEQLSKLLKTGVITQAQFDELVTKI